jgi:branched-chain amino acid transport system substrate-binding protein
VVIKAQKNNGGAHGENPSVQVVIIDKRKWRKDMRRFAEKRQLGKGIIVAVSIVALLGLGWPARTILAAHEGAKSVVKIGVSVSLTGDFSGDGTAILHGYQLWQNYVNNHGGLLGHPVRIVFKDDGSSQTQVATNYGALISSDHVTFTVGGFSSLLTIPASREAARFGYAFPEPAGGGPAVFQSEQQAHFLNIFFVQPAPVVDNFASLARWILSLPKHERPTSAAYASEDDPFAHPQVDVARQILTKGGVKNVTPGSGSQNGVIIWPAESPDIQAVGLKVASTHAGVVVLGTTGLPEGAGLIKAFIQQHYNPKVLTEASGPDQGAQFSAAVGAKNTEGIMVPAGWYARSNTFENKAFVAAYLKRFGGNVGGISADAAEAFAVGQVIAQGVKKDGVVAPAARANSALIRELHNGRFQTDEGPMKFNKLGQPQGKMFLVQWQHGRAVPVYPTNVALAKPEYPKPKWR